MRDDLIEIIAAMVERLRQILAEEPIEQTRAAHQRQRQPHQSPRAFEDQYGKQRADHEISARRIAVAGNQVGVEDPLVQPAQEARTADQPAERAAEIAFGGEVADQAEGHQQQEADMNAAHHLARQIIERGDVKLEGRKDDADGMGEIAPAAGAEACRKTMLEIVELDLDGLFIALSLQHVGRPRPG
jgi:glycerate-2-kinase